MADKDVYQRVESARGKRFYAPELGKTRQMLVFTNIEALIMLSLSNAGAESLFQEEETFELRKAIEHGKSGSARLDLTKHKIRQIEKMLPLFGTIDESIYGPLRIKLNAAILNMDTVTFEEVSEDVVTTGESPFNSPNYAKDSP